MGQTNSHSGGSAENNRASKRNSKYKYAQFVFMQNVINLKS